MKGYSFINYVLLLVNILFGIFFTVIMARRILSEYHGLICEMFGC